MDKIISEFKKKKCFILAIDGKCASGKTTLASRLNEELGGNLFHMDDFFLPLEKRTKERLEEPGGNVDYERFLNQVLLPLSKQQDIYYQPFDCSTMSLGQGKIIKYAPINIIEGSYALHPTLVPYYSDVIVLDISSTTQLHRLFQRNPDKYQMFIDQWIPLENKYFAYYHIYEKYPVFLNE